jgi:hypothetical protein
MAPALHQLAGLLLASQSLRCEGRAVMRKREYAIGAM